MAAHGRDLARHRGQPRLDQLRHVGAREQIAQVRVRAGAVEVHHLHAADVEPAPTQHVGLDRHVGQVLLLHAGGGLDLDQAEAALPSRSRMSTDTKTPSARKAASYTAGAPSRERQPRRLQPPLVGVVGKVHEHAARHVGPGQRARPGGPGRRAAWRASSTSSSPAAGSCAIHQSSLWHCSPAMARDLERPCGRADAASDATDSDRSTASASRAGPMYTPATEPQPKGGPR